MDIQVASWNNYRMLVFKNCEQDVRWVLSLSEKKAKIILDHIEDIEDFVKAGEEIECKKQMESL